MTRDTVAKALDGDRAALAGLAETLLESSQRCLPRLLHRHRARAGAYGRAALEQLQYDFVEDLLYRYPRALRRWDPQAGLGFEGYIALLADGWLRRRLSTVRGSPWALRILGAALGGPRRRVEPEGADAMSLEDEVTLRLAVARAVGLLAERDRELLVAYYIDGRTTDELAAELGVAGNSVHQRLHRLRARLASSLGTDAEAFAIPAANRPRPGAIGHD